MPLSLSLSTTVFTSSRPKFFIIFILLHSHGAIAAAKADNNHKKAIGAIIDINSRIGKEEKGAMETAIRDFNNASNYTYKLALHVHDSGRDPLQAASAAHHLIKDLETQAIVGMGTWLEMALIAEVGNQAQVPVLSMATVAVTSKLTSAQWPFLVRMANDNSLQMRCVAAIVGSYKWKKVISIYEDGAYGGDSGMIALLSDALRDVGSEIEYRLALPPLSSLSDPNVEIQKELEKIKSKHSRVFIVLYSSLPLATHLFVEAKKMGMMGKESVWITTDTITNLLDSVNSSILSTMQGVVGIKTYFSDASESFREFYVKFRQIFRLEYPEEENSKPGIYALQAYDTVSTLIQAIERLTNNSTSKTLLANILSSNFNGLSGEIRFKDGELLHSPAYQIVNVLRKSHNELGFWLPEFGFSKSIIVNETCGNNSRGDDVGAMDVLDDPVYWPGGLRRVPRGWAMISDAKPLRIGVPGTAKFEMFVKVEQTENGSQWSENGTQWSENETQWYVSGFCISVFNEAVKLLGYDLQYKFEPYFSSNYTELVKKVHKKEFDAVVGDVMILANRYELVDFTHPYADSGLSLVVPVEESQKAWILMKPFTTTMWLMTGAIFVYTMFVVWFLERGSNPDFSGPWNSQLCTALWFTFSTLFFAHRERLHRNYTQVVIVVWLFVVLVLTSSYTASLTSMLTVPRLKPTMTNIELLKRNSLKVGCNGDSLVKNYIQSAIGTNPDNIIIITNEDNYLEEFRNGNIAAAFLEIPYDRVFLSNHCKEYAVTKPVHIFGGFGFVFPKGSPLATDISTAILKLLENGRLTELEEEWFPHSSACSNPTNTEDKSLSLSLKSFWGLYIITGGTSTIVFLLFLVHLQRDSGHHQEAYEGNISPMDKSLRYWTSRLRLYFHKGQLHFQDKAPTRVQVVDVDVSSSSGESQESP